MPEHDYQRFTDFADEKDNQPLEGAKKSISEVLNLEILITSFRLAPSKVNGGKCLTIQFQFDGRTFVAFTGSGVLANQLERYKDKIPFMTKIVKRDKYFTLS